jgi:hypothetical protein
MRILTPKNTIRRCKQTKGYRFIEVNECGGMTDYTVFEVVDASAGVAGACKLFPLATWSEYELGPAEHKDLPIRYNNFTPYPTFAEETK